MYPSGDIQMKIDERCDIYIYIYTYVRENSFWARVYVCVLYSTNKILIIIINIIIN